MSAKRDLANMFISDLEERPGDFTSSDFEVSDRKTGRVWWIANKGYGFALRRPVEFKVGNIGGLYSYHGGRCYRAYQRWLVNRMTVEIQRPPKPDLKVVPIK